MAGKRRPMDVNLAVVKGGGGKHWTKAEIEERQRSEVKAGKPRSLTPPKWLSKPAAKLFRAYAKELLALPGDVVSKLDTGTLARYCDCEATYGEASRHKEIWMAQHQYKIPGLMVGVGAAFDYLAGNIQRAPEWMQKANLEWFYRLCQDPKRLFKRYFVTNTDFIWNAVIRGK